MSCNRILMGIYLILFSVSVSSFWFGNTKSHLMEKNIKQLNDVVEELFKNEYLMCPLGTVSEVKTCTASKLRMSTTTEKCGVTKELYNCLHSGLLTCGRKGAAVDEVTSSLIDSELRTWGCQPLDKGSNGANYMVSVAPLVTFLPILTFAIFRFNLLLHVI